jgi:hypothetical protein
MKKQILMAAVAAGALILNACSSEPADQNNPSAELGDTEKQEEYAEPEELASDSEDNNEEIESFALSSSDIKTIENYGTCSTVYKFSIGYLNSVPERADPRTQMSIDRFAHMAAIYDIAMAEVWEKYPSELNGELSFHANKFNKEFSANNPQFSLSDLSKIDKEKCDFTKVASEVERIQRDYKETYQDLIAKYKVTKL